MKAVYIQHGCVYIKQLILRIWMYMHKAFLFMTVLPQRNVKKTEYMLFFIIII